MGCSSTDSGAETSANSVEDSDALLTTTVNITDRIFSENTGENDMELEDQAHENQDEGYEGTIP